uniref:Uncharacterized protein n=1 Tax=Caenorhabditis japonica TaxID=281687 RepID=A0A8R1E7D3_CAEJA
MRRNNILNHHQLRENKAQANGNHCNHPQQLNCRRHSRYPHEYAYYPCIRQCLIKLTRDRIPETNGIGRTSSLSLRTQQPKQMEPDENNKSERFLKFSQAAGTMHKDINAIEKQEDTIVEEVVVHLQSNSEQLRSKAKRHQNDEQTSLQHLQESALTWLPLPPKFAKKPSQERSRTTNDGKNRKIMAPMTQQMKLENDFHDHACSAPGSAPGINLLQPLSQKNWPASETRHQNHVHLLRQQGTRSNQLPTQILNSRRILWNHCRRIGRKMESTKQKKGEATTEFDQSITIFSFLSHNAVTKCHSRVPNMPIWTQIINVNITPIGLSNNYAHLCTTRWS